MYCTRRPSNRGPLERTCINNKLSQTCLPLLSMAGLIFRLPDPKLLAADAISLTQNTLHSLLSYRILLRTKDTAVIPLLIYIALVTAVCYALVAREHQPQPLTDGSVEPPMIPSWIPWVGSGFDYFTHPLTFFKKYRFILFSTFD